LLRSANGGKTRRAGGEEALSDLLAILIGGLKFGAIYALTAIGVVVIHKATRTVNFAQGALVMLGAFGGFLVVVVYQLPYWVAYLVVPPVIGLMAAGLELIILRPLRSADLFTVVIATVFLGIAISEGFRLIYKAELLAVPATFTGPPIRLGNVVLTQDTMWVIAGALATAAIALLLFSQARLGISMRAMASNPRGAQLCGFSVDRVYLTAWFLGGALAGLAGLFIAPAKGVSADLSIQVIAAAFVAAVIGGFDSLVGAIVGGVLLGLTETIAAFYVSSAFKNTVSFLLLFAVLLWRPQGLFPGERTRDV
jgi:branched-chain amino acid transport system permease protein